MGGELIGFLAITEIETRGLSHGISNAVRPTVLGGCGSPSGLCFAAADDDTAPTGPSQVSFKHLL